MASLLRSIARRYSFSAFLLFVCSFWQGCDHAVEKAVDNKRVNRRMAVRMNGLFP